MNKWKNIFNFSDEIDILNSTFIQMLLRLKGAYSELKSTQDSLSQTEKMVSVGTLAAGLAHEINNPIAGIRNCLRRISDKPENIKQNAEYLDMMNEAIGKIENVVQGMLSFSRKQELTFSRIDIIKSIENTIGLTNYQLELAGITLKRHYQFQSLIALASPNHLEQVFVNILLNSIDAIAEKKQQQSELRGEITITVKQSEGFIKIQFSDNGTGMPEDKVASLFDPFFTLKKIRQGTGLGMAVSYNIISSHLGQITGKNKEDGGFCITITLPELQNLKK
jgi:two-component system NtrC family sensor kinase